jgi:hypothetical protein
MCMCMCEYVYVYVCVCVRVCVNYKLSCIFCIQNTTQSLNSVNPVHECVCECVSECVCVRELVCN